MSKDITALKFVGLMGRPVAAVRTDPDGHVRAVGGCFNTVEDAERFLCAGDRIYRRAHPSSEYAIVRELSESGKCYRGDLSFCGG